jgi:hypothetical protein
MSTITRAEKVTNLQANNALQRDAGQSIETIMFWSITWFPFRPRRRVQLGPARVTLIH